jgi:hypothetical protein
MKTKYVIFLFVILIIPAIFLKIYFENRQATKKRFKEQLGTYKIDIQKTNLGSYENDSNTYKELTITFNSDSTFICNKKVPFMLDSIGFWKAGGSGVEEWNYLFYKEEINGNTISDQFDQSYGRDSSFMINSVTPQIGENSVNQIFFNKFHPTGASLSEVD